MENKCPALQYQGGGEGGTHTSSCQRRELRGPSLTDYTLSQGPSKECALPNVSQKWRDFQGKWCHREEFCREVEVLGEDAEETASFLQRSYVKRVGKPRTVLERSWTLLLMEVVGPQFYSRAKFQECLGFYCTLRTKLCCFQDGWICHHFLEHLWLLTSMAL